jgi:hypothetical protein
LACGGGLDSTVSGQGPVAGCCECGDESSGSCAMELLIVSYIVHVCSIHANDKYPQYNSGFHVVSHRFFNVLW